MWRRLGEQLPCREGGAVSHQHTMEGPPWESCITGFRYQDARTRECPELINPLGPMRPLNGPYGVRSLMVIGKDDLGWTEVLEVKGTA